MIGIEKMQRDLLLLLSVAGAICNRAFGSPVAASGGHLSLDYARIFTADIDARYLKQGHDIINAWKHLGDVVSANQGLLTSSWMGKHMRYAQ